ncbi:MAG: hypothetical protein KC457_07395 [Myxococcales bacterium]|nr:hypothetical protein [Myxococcales bacterium]
MRRASLLLSTTIAASLVCATLELPATAHAGDPAAYWFAAAPEDGGGEDALAEAQDLYQQGEIKFQTADYEEALALWKKAYAMLPDGEENRAIRHALVYNIAEAHSQAYEVTRNPTHLRKAKILLENYRAEHRALYGDEPEAVKERAEADERLAELDRKIAASEEAGEQASPINEAGGGGAGTDGAGTGGPDTGNPPPPTKPMTPRQQWDYEVKMDPMLGPKWAKGNRRLVGGAVMTGIGGIFALISLGSFVVAPNSLFPGAAWATGGATGVIALALLIPGGIFLGTGVALRKEVLKAKPRPVGTLVPMLTPGGGGVGWAMRF